MEFALTAYWLAATLALAAAAVPLCARVFRGFPDRGAALAPGVAFAVVGLVAYWVGHVRYGSVVAALSVLSVFALGALAARNADLPPPRSVAAPLAVFVAVFAFFVAVRAVDPAVHAGGGEKFLDYALVETIMHADVLPPEDPWWAGEPVRYYYGGILSLTAFAEPLGVAPKYAYNLSLATCFAALAAGSYGLAAAVADHRGRSRVLAGVLAVAFVCFAGNLATPARVLAGFLPEAFAREYFSWVWAGLRAAEPYHAATDLGRWGYWIGRYVIPSTITVFPMWTYINGDLHAHVIAPIFLVPAAAVAFEGWRATDARRRAALLLGVLPGFAGMLAVTSTWSLPTAAGLGFLAFALADTHPASALPDRVRGRLPTTGPRGELSRYALAVAAGLAVGLGGFVLAAPFFLFHAPPNGGIALLPPRSPLGPFLLAYGTFVAVFGAYLARRAGLGTQHTALAFAGWLALLAAGFLLDVAAVAVLGPFLLAAWYLVRTDRAGFAAVLFVAGAGMLLAVEFAYAKVWPHDPNAVRWNTVYKVSMQVAVLWGVGAAVAAASLLQPVLDRARSALDDAAARTAAVSRGDVAGAAVVVLVLASAMTFPALTMSDHFGEPVREPGDATLDATQFVETYHPHEAEAFEWLRANTDGQPTMLAAAHQPIYTWLSAPPTFTGVPAVLGWVHEKGYRPDAAYEERRADVEFMYRGDRATQALLFDKYDVEYVYYGPLERDRYPDAEFGGPGVRQVYENEKVTIYRVNPDEACEATDLTCFPD